MSPNEIRRKFFYAMHDAKMYDATIELVVPFYTEMHRLIQQLAGEHHAFLSDKLAFDVGAGTGADSIMLLKEIPDLCIVGIDLCEPMLEIFRAKAADAGIAGERFSVYVADALQDDAYIRAREIASNEFGGRSFGLAFSAFTIHHFTPEEKRDVFQRIHDLLLPGGIFILGDLFNCNGESPWMTDAILNFEIQWMDKCFSDAIEKETDSFRASSLKALRENWIQHYLKDNKLSSVSEHFEMLRDSGFAEVANPLRYSQVGVVWAKK